MPEPGRLPNLIIIGGQKCGTTSLHFYLSLHPHVHMSTPKELNYFVESRNWYRGLAWYQSHFIRQAGVIGEASPSYTAFPFFPGVAARMHAVVPEAKLIYLVRDPLDRLRAGYVHRVAALRERRPFDEAVADPGTGILCRSQYATQLEQFLAFYPLSRILILEQEDLRRRRRSALQAVYAFLGLDEIYHPLQFTLQHHRTAHKRAPTRLGQRLLGLRAVQAALEACGAKKDFVQSCLLLPFSRKVPWPEISPALRRQLVDALLPDITRFRALTGQPFAHWSL